MPRSRDSKSCEPCARTGSPLVPAARHQGRGAPCGESFWHWLGADGGHGHAQPPFRSSRLIGAERQPTSDCRQSLQQSPCDGDARHRSVDRSNACAAQNPEPRPGMPGARILPLKGVGKRNAAAASAWSSATMPVHATAARAGWVPSSRVTSRPDPWSPCPPAR